MNSSSEQLLAEATLAGSELPGYDSHAGRLLKLVHWTGAASRQLRRRLTEVAAALELSDNELMVLWLCTGGGRVQVELAGAIGISPAQMSGLVERLRSRDLVAMHRLARDRRRQLWRTTPAGQHLLADAANDLNAIASSIQRDLSEQEQQSAEALCRRLAEAAAAEHDRQCLSKEAA